MWFFWCPKAGKCCDLGIANRRDCRDAGARRLAVEMHGASAALREAATEMRVVQAEIITQRVKQRHVRIGVDRMGRPIDGKGKSLGHGVQLPELNVKPRAYGRRPLSDASFPTLADRRLVPHSGFGNAPWR